MRPKSVHMALPLFAALLGTACQAAIIRAPGVEEEEPPDPMEIENPELFFTTEVQPILEMACASCHEDFETSQGADFLTPGDYYASVMTWEGLVVAGEPEMSELLNKGEHRGPAFSANDAATVSRWIVAEGMNEEPPPPPPPEEPIVTPTFPVEEGENRIPLVDVGLPGAEVVFEAMRINSGANMLLSDVRFTAATGGLAVTHPVFIIHDDTEMTSWPDPRDPFADTSVSTGPGSTVMLTNSHALAPFPDPGSIAIQFDSVEMQDPP